MSDFKEKLDEAKKALKAGEMLIVKEPVFEENTGEVLFNGAIYTVKNDMPGCKYRTSDNPVNSNLETEVQKGVSVADFSDYVDNRDIIRALIANSEKSQFSLRRFVNDMAKEDGSEIDYEDDFDTDYFDDLELATMTQTVKDAFVNQQNAEVVIQKETSKEEEERSSDDDEQVDDAVGA